MDNWMMASLASNKGGDGAKKKSMYNLKLTSAQVDKLGDVLHARGWPTREVQYLSLIHISEPTRQAEMA